MNKSLRIALAASALAIAYPVSAWVLGRQIESAMNEQYANVGGNPFVKIVQRDFRRGIFSSTETVSIEFFGEMMKAAALRDAEATSAALKPMTITLRSEIRHGPFPGGMALAAAVSDSELILDTETAKQLAPILGDQKPLVAHTVYRFDRGGVITLSSPAFSTTLPAAEGETPDQVTWGGITIAINFARGMSSYTFQADAPKFEIIDGKGGHLRMSALRASGDQRRIFDDEPMLYAGSQKFSIGRIEAGKPGKPGENDEGGNNILLKEVSYAIDLPVNGEFIDLAAKIGAEVVQVGKNNFGPAHYDFSLRHLHARTVAKLHHALLDLYAEPAKLTNAANVPALFAPFAEPGFELLKHGPEISIDRLSFNSPHGEATLAARARLNEMKPEDLGNPALLIGKLQASAELSFPEALVGEFAGDGKADPEQNNDEGAPGDAARRQAADLAAQGYITLENGTIRSKVAFGNGQLTVNGKPLNPMAMGGGMAKNSSLQN